MPDPARLDTGETKGRVQYSAGESHAADRRREKLRVLAGRTGDDAAIGYRQGKALDMLAEAAGAMVILAVDIGGDHSSDAHQLGSRNHGRKIPLRKKRRDDVRKQNARLDSHPAAHGVEGAKAIEPEHREAGHRADSGVAIGAAIAPRHKSREALLQASGLGHRARLDERCVEPRISPPAGHFHISALRAKVKLRSRRYLAKLPIARPMVAPAYLASSVPPIFQNAISKLQKSRVISTLKAP